MKIDCCLDKLSDGFPEKTITQVYGDFATGKTTLCLQLCAKISELGKKSIYIDTEGSFSPKRILQIDPNIDLKKILVLELYSFENQCKMMETLEEKIDENIGCIVMDSMVSLYRLKGGDYDERRELNRLLGKQLLVLSKIAREYDIPVVITNQIYEDFDNGITPLGGSVLKYWSKVIIELRKIPKKTGWRKATIIKHRYKKQGNSCDFRIGEKGII
ncbi:MAG: DNA repair and recombination protein RadB [Euryarchaeota archaeon]|nr:DNA repair and recombination protein RadB [Euryarchaeota archaeon]